MQSEKMNGLQNSALMRAACLDEQSFPSATLYIVGLPIGNAADITLRALWTLSVCDTIACEDTRETRKLLDRYAISTPSVSVHEHNERSGAQKLIEHLKAGERVALVTDAGTPAVSDPGARVVQSVREAGFRIVPVPGACACISALSAAGLDAYRFIFAGFVEPNKKTRSETVAELCQRGDAFVLYEAPHRICELLILLSEKLHAGRRVVIAREITKRFESFYTVKSENLASWAKAHEPKGEYVVLVDEKVSRSFETPDGQTLRWARALASEMPVSRAAAVAAKISGFKREVLYKILLQEKNASEAD